MDENGIWYPAGQAGFPYPLLESTSLLPNQLMPVYSGGNCYMSTHIYVYVDIRRYIYIYLRINITYIYIYIYIHIYAYVSTFNIH